MWCMWAMAYLFGRKGKGVLGMTSLSEQYKKKLRRSKGIKELYSLAEDMDYIFNTVQKMGYLSKRYFKKQGRKGMLMYEPYDWLVFESQHEAFNCAYEAVINFNKLGRLEKLIEFYRRKHNG